MQKSVTQPMSSLESGDLAVKMGLHAYYLLNSGHASLKNLTFRLEMRVLVL